MNTKKLYTTSILHVDGLFNTRRLGGHRGGQVKLLKQLSVTPVKRTMG